MKMKSLTLLGSLVVLMLSSTVMAKTDVAEQMQWFKDAKFGMFIHFQAPRKGDFNPSQFDAAQWVRIAKAGGVKYMTLTTSQGSYVPLWNSAVSDQDVTDRTSWKRDIVKELAEACKAEGIRMGCYYPIADPPNPLYNEDGSDIKLEVAGTVSMDPAHMQLHDGTVILDTYNATIHDLKHVPGKPSKAIDMKMFTVPDRRPLLPGDITGPWDYQMYRKAGEWVMPGRAITISGFQTKGQALSWDFKLYRAGTYEIVLNCRGAGRQNRTIEGKLRGHVAGQSVESELRLESNGQARLGKVQIDSPGTHTFTLEVASDFRNAPRYASVTLVPVSQEL